MYRYRSANYKITTFINQESCYTAFMPVAKKEKQTKNNNKTQNKTTTKHGPPHAPL